MTANRSVRQVRRDGEPDEEAVPHSMLWAAER
jgi:hypothetical protein